MREIGVEIKGLSPLLQHRYVFSDEKESSAKRRTGSKNYAEEWKDYLYWDPELGVYQPGVHIEAAMIKAAAGFLINGRGKKTYKDLFKSAVFVTPDYIPYGLVGDPDTLKKDGKIGVDRRLVRVNRAGVERLRPKLETWSLIFSICVQDNQISNDTVQQVLEYAGRHVGIGDFRPKFGRFSIVKFK